MSQPYMSGTANTKLVEALKKVLADTYVLYFKTHSFHWNVEGPRFKSLHELFEIQYTELWAALDELAERIRALDAYAPLNSKEMVQGASLKDAGQMPDADGMVQALADDNAAIVKTIYAAIEAAQEAGDEGTTDMMVARSQIHEKTAWMLRSMTKK